MFSQLERLIIGHPGECGPLGKPSREECDESLYFTSKSPLVVNLIQIPSSASINILLIGNILLFIIMFKYITIPMHIAQKDLMNNSKSYHSQ